MIMLMTVALAERARLIDSGDVLDLDEPTFAANLTDVLVGVLEAPLRVNAREVVAPRLGLGSLGPIPQPAHHLLLHHEVEEIEAVRPDRTA